MTLLHVLTAHALRDYASPSQAYAVDLRTWRQRTPHLPLEVWRRPAVKMRDEDSCLHPHPVREPGGALHCPDCHHYVSGPLLGADHDA